MRYENRVVDPKHRVTDIAADIILLSLVRAVAIFVRVGVNERGTKLGTDERNRHQR